MTNEDGGDGVKRALVLSVHVGGHENAAHAEHQGDSGDFSLKLLHGLTCGKRLVTATLHRVLNMVSTDRMIPFLTLTYLMCDYESK